VVVVSHLWTCALVLILLNPPFSILNVDGSHSIRSTPLWIDPPSTLTSSPLPPSPLRPVTGGQAPCTAAVLSAPPHPPRTSRSPVPLESSYIPTLTRHSWRTMATEETPVKAVQVKLVLLGESFLFYH
jgi:hypothetical protein